MAENGMLDLTMFLPVDIMTNVAHGWEEGIPAEAKPKTRWGGERGKKNQGHISANFCFVLTGKFKSKVASLPSPSEVKVTSSL